jgi:hypothetical protein
MNDDHQSYHRFTGRARLEKSMNSLIGLVEGISIDGVINEIELGFVRAWLHENRELRNHHPFTELMPVVDAAIDDGILTDDERLNILWLCEKLRSVDFFDAVTADLQRLHAIMAAVASDGIITETELRGLSNWLSDHGHLKTSWPYDEVDSILTSVLVDGVIDAKEHELLQRFFSEFVAISDNRTIVSPRLDLGESVVGLCAVCPEIDFFGKRFCFTGSSSKYSRVAFNELVEQLGGSVANSISAKVDYVIIGADGNPCWAYACYGRKVEMAVKLRKQGIRILLIHENDFHDAVADHR